MSGTVIKLSVNLPLRQRAVVSFPRPSPSLPHFSLHLPQTPRLLLPILPALTLHQWPLVLCLFLHLPTHPPLDSPPKLLPVGLLPMAIPSHRQPASVVDQLPSPQPLQDFPLDPPRASPAALTTRPTFILDMAASDRPPAPQSLRAFLLHLPLASLALLLLEQLEQLVCQAYHLVHPRAFHLPQGFKLLLPVSLESNQNEGRYTLFT